MKEYTISKLANMAGISTRTLRYYDECGLLPSHRDSSNGYRIYGQQEINLLQQILFYRELGLELGEIKKILYAPDFNLLASLNKHLSALKVRREQINTLIQNVEKSTKAMKGEIIMKDKEKFEGFKEKLINDNEQQYGEEIRARYGNEAINRSNSKLKGITKEQFAKSEQLTLELNNTLKAAFDQGDPSGSLAQEACKLHKEWLCFYWDDGTYNKEAHLGITQTYVDDDRFRAYYDKIVPGLAVFLRDAVQIYCGD